MDAGFSSLLGQLSVNRSSLARLHFDRSATTMQCFEILSRPSGPSGNRLANIVHIVLAYFHTPKCPPRLILSTKKFREVQCERVLLFCTSMLRFFDRYHIFRLSILVYISFCIYFCFITLFRGVVSYFDFSVSFSDTQRSLFSSSARASCLFL